MRLRRTLEGKRATLRHSGRATRDPESRGKFVGASERHPDNGISLDPSR
jgi:hypothetical protein